MHLYLCVRACVRGTNYVISKLQESCELELENEIE